MSLDFLFNYLMFKIFRMFSYLYNINLIHNICIFYIERIIMRLLRNNLPQEMKTILRKGNENKGNSFILTSLFLIILRNNFLGLFPYIFIRTRHLTLTLTLALPL